VLGFKDEECLDSASEKGGVHVTCKRFKSHALLVSERVGGGGKCSWRSRTAVLTTGAAMLNQMAEAKAKKETLAKRSGGATLEDNGRQRQAFQSGEFERGLGRGEGFE
jgi:hypothetical protein